VKIRVNDFAMEYGIPCEVVDTLEAATKIAYNFASEGDIILLSPACASWDQFKDFEIRGKIFKEYVSQL
jgi:UDP-N-acetylmuramoylalanine--D-glutamate ligase